MPNTSLLPGVTGESCPPPVRCDARAAVRRARRLALVRDGLQVALVITVDLLFAAWPEARLPVVDREASLQVLRLANVAMIATVWTSRIAPQWRARRIAATWCRSERERFLDSAEAHTVSLAAAQKAKRPGR